MWLMTKIGFYSITQAPGRSPGEMQIRARVKKDLQNLVRELKPDNRPEIIETPGKDYRYRIFVSRTTVADLLAIMLCDLDYCNFKDAVKKQKDQANKCDAYLRVWATMAGLQPGHTPQTQLGGFAGTELARHGPKEKWMVISPDGVPIRKTPFSSMDAAELGLKNWLFRFYPQGYYKTADGREIAIDAVESECKFQRA